MVYNGRIHPNIYNNRKKKEDAKKIANNLIEKRLAGCTQIIGPITSTYWWKGNVETAEEFLILVKSRKELYEEIEKAKKEIHPYETPEIIAMPIVEGSKDYLEWLKNELKKD